MPLAGYQPEQRTIELARGNSFQVKGLSLNDIAVLIREHFPDLDAIAVLIDHGIEQVSRDQVQSFATMLVSQAPGLVANMISLAAGEGDASDAEKLPAPVQVRALVEIGELTFAEVGGIKKGWEMIATLLKNQTVKDKLTKTLKRTG